ncbi:MAG: hypothetical protein ACI9UU_001333, partial [Candidatus Azotimanducaceae bacterium]
TRGTILFQPGSGCCLKVGEFGHWLDPLRKQVSGNG